MKLTGGVCPRCDYAETQDDAQEGGCGWCGMRKSEYQGIIERKAREKKWQPVFDILFGCFPLHSFFLSFVMAVMVVYCVLWLVGVGVK